MVLGKQKCDILRNVDKWGSLKGEREDRREVEADKE